MRSPCSNSSVSHNYFAASAVSIMYSASIIIITILSHAVSAPYPSCTEGALRVPTPASQFPQSDPPSTNTVSSRTVRESRTHQVSPFPPSLPEIIVTPNQIPNYRCLRACKKQLLSCLLKTGLTPILIHNCSSQSKLSLKLQHTNHTQCTPNAQSLTIPSSSCRLLLEDMSDLQLPQPSPGSLLEIHACSPPDFIFTHFIDTRAIPFEDECSNEVISRGSIIPGSGQLRYVSTHIHGRPSLASSSVFARPAKNLANDLNGRPAIRPAGRGRAPNQRSSSSLRGRRGRGGRPPSPQEAAPTPASASFLAGRINMAIGSIQNSSRSITPSQIIFKAFDRNGLSDDALLQQSGPTTFFLHLDANANPEAVAALCNSQQLHFPLHPAGRPLSHKSWIFENPLTSDIGPAVSENHTVYITFGVTPALTREEFAMGIHPTPEIPLLWDCDEFLANRKLRTATLFLHMTATADVDENHPFHKTKLTCEELLQLWHFSFVRLLGLPQDKNPSLSLMDHFCLAAQASSLHSAASLAEFSPVCLPIITDQGDMPLAVFKIYISLDNPADSLDEPADTNVIADEEQKFRNHSIQISCQAPVDPEFIVNAWSTEILNRIQSLAAQIPEPTAAHSTHANKVEDAIILALKDVSTIDLLRVNASANVQVPKPYRVDPRHSVGNRTKLLTIAPVNPRVVQFALSPRGSSRLQVLPPSTSTAAASPVTLFVGTAGVRLNGASTTISLPPTSNRAKRLAALREMEAALSPLQSPNAVGTPSPVTQQQPPTYASLFHKPATPLQLQQHPQPQGNNPLFLQHPTNMEHDAQDASNQVCQPVYQSPPKVCPHIKCNTLQHNYLTNKNASHSPYPCKNRSYSSSNNLPSNSNSWLSNTAKSRSTNKGQQTKPISCSRSLKQQTKTGRSQLRNSLQSMPLLIPRRRHIWCFLVGPTAPLMLPANPAAGARNVQSGGWRKNSIYWKPCTTRLSLLHTIPQASTQLPPLQILPQDQPPPATSLLQRPNPLDPPHRTSLTQRRPSQPSRPLCSLQTLKARWPYIQVHGEVTPRIFEVIYMTLHITQTNTPSLHSLHLKNTLRPTPITNTLLHCHITNNSVLLPIRTLNTVTQVTATCPLNTTPQLLSETHETTKNATLCYLLEHLKHTKVDDTLHTSILPTLWLSRRVAPYISTYQKWPHRTMTTQSNVIRIPCSCLTTPRPEIPGLFDTFHLDHTRHQNITLISLVVPPQIILVLKTSYFILAPTLHYSNPRYLLHLALHIGQIKHGSPAKHLLSAAHITLLKIYIFHTLISILYRLTHHSSKKFSPYKSPKQILQRGPCTPIKSWLNTLPDRFGSTILSPPDTPWPPRSILNQQWRPALPHKFASHKTFSKISKSKWNKYVKHKNKAYLHDLNCITQIFIPHIIMLPHTSDLLTNLTERIYSGSAEGQYNLYLTAYRCLSRLAYNIIIITLSSDPRIILLMLLMCAGDIHPNPGPPNVSPTLLSKYYSCTPFQLTSWIRKQNHQTLHFGDPNGQPYTTRPDMLSGFFQEYLDKSDQTNLISKILTLVYSTYPELSQTNIKVVRVGEEHDMQRGHTPFNWLNPQQTTATLRARAAVMHDPLNCRALVIPRVANAHFTTYIFHSDGVAYYDSLSFSPDDALISKYCEALNSFYLKNPHLATTQIKQKLKKIATSPPVSMPCTQQSPEPNPWSCGYCSANVCIQAVLQQSVPSITQSLTVIYELQSAFLKFKVTGQSNVWGDALHALMSEHTSPKTHELPSNSHDTYLQASNQSANKYKPNSPVRKSKKSKPRLTQSRLNSTPRSSNLTSVLPKQNHSSTTSSLDRPNATNHPDNHSPTSNHPSGTPQLQKKDTFCKHKKPTLSNKLFQNTTTPKRNKPHSPSSPSPPSNPQASLTQLTASNNTLKSQTKKRHSKTSKKPHRSNLSNLKQATLCFKTPNKPNNNLSPPSPYFKENSSATSHIQNKTTSRNVDSPPSKRARSLPDKHSLGKNQATNCEYKNSNGETNINPPSYIHSPTNQQNATESQSVKATLTKEQKAHLTRTRKIITRRNNRNRKNKLRPITNFLAFGGPQSRAIRRQPRTLSTKKFKAGNLFTCTQALQNTQRLQSYCKSPTPLRRLKTVDTSESPDPRPPPQFSQEPLTPPPSQPTQEEPIENILLTHSYQHHDKTNTPQQHADTPKPSTAPSHEHQKHSDPDPLIILTLNLSKGGENGLSLVDLEQIVKDESPDILLLTETPYSSNSKPLTNLLKRLKYAYTYNPTPTPTPDQTYLPIEARLPKAAEVRSTGGALCAYKKEAPWAKFVKPVITPNPDITSRVAAIKIQHPAGEPRLVVATYIPQKHPELQREIWAYLRALPLIENLQHILIGGDFQEDIHLPESRLRKHGLHPIRYSPSPTFCPPHAPQINTIIDGFSTAHKDDTWNSPSNVRVSNIPTAYADHHALILNIDNANLPNMNLPDLLPTPAPPRLQLPLSSEYISKWQLAVKQAFTHQIQNIVKEVEDLLAEHSHHQDPFWTEPTTKKSALRYAEEITDILANAASKAYEIMPLAPTRPPQKTKNQHKTRQRWSEQKMTEIKEAALRTRLLRKFNNAGKHKNSKAYPLHRLINDLQTIPILSEHSQNLNLTPSVNDIQDDITTEITDIIKDHKKYTKRIVAAAKKENTQKYSQFLETTFEQKPKVALETIIATQKGKEKNIKLNLIKNATTGKLYTQTEDCLTAITAEQTDNLSATVQHPLTTKYPWSTEGCPDPINLTPPPNLPTSLLDTITRTDYDLCLKRSAKGKATGPDNIPGELIKSMPPDFHRAMFSIFILLARTRTTPTSWLQSNTVLIYKKGDPCLMDNYRPIALANHLYKIWTALIAQILTDFVECNNILSDAQEGYRKGRSTNRAVAHLQLLLEDAHTHRKNLYITYIDFKGAYPSVDHTQLRQVIQDLGIPQDVCELIESLHKGAHTTFLTPHGPTPPIPIKRGTLQGDPLSTILFDLMMEPLTRWLQSGNHGYKTAATGLLHEGILYADDVALTSKSIRATQTQLQKIEQFGEWSHIRVNPSKCRITGWVPEIQTIQKKAERDMALKNSLAHVNILGSHIPTLAQDEPLPGGYLGCQLTASLSSGAQKQWLNDTLKEAQAAIQSAPVKIKTKIAMIQYLIYSKVRYTMGQMMYDYEFLSRMDGLIASTIKQAWGFPRYLPTAAAQSSKDELGLDSPSLAMDYGATAAATLKDLLNDNGRLGKLAKASLAHLAKEKQNWPKELILDPGIGFLSKAQALLQQTQTKIDGIPTSWQGNSLCDSLTHHILEAEPNPLHNGLDDTPPQYPPIRKVLRRTKPLWSHGLTELASLLTPKTTAATPHTLITFEDLQRQYPHIARQKGTAAALTYITDLLTANSPEQFSNNRSRPKSATQPPRVIAGRWLTGKAPLHISCKPRSRQTPSGPNNNQTRSESQTATKKRPRKNNNSKPTTNPQCSQTHQAPSPAYPKRLTIHPNTHISTHAIDPDRDAVPNPAQHTYEAFLVPANQNTPQMVRVCDPQGNAVSTKDLTLERYNFLAEQHATYSSNRNFHLDLAELLRRYHPKAKTQNPQGRPLNLKNHWALPQLLMNHLTKWTNSPSTELFASPLNCLPHPYHTYYSASQEDAVFGARYNSFSYSWRGHCVGNPEYEHEDMLKAMQHAIASANASPQPFSCILILPRWKDTPYRRQDILLNPNVKIVTGIEARHLKYVPANKEMANPPDPNQTSAHWAADIILVSNQAGYQAIDWPRVKKELPIVLRQTANSPDFYVNWFPHPADLTYLKQDKFTTKQNNKTTHIQPTHTNLVQATDAPTPPPLDPAPFVEHTTWPASPNLQELPAFSINKSTPLTVIELCAGIGTGLEALLKAGYTIGSYTWADINPDGHTVLQHTIPTLHKQYKKQFPPSATQGWDTKLPFDINLITRELLMQKFPTGAHVVIAGPPCQPYSIAGKGKGLTDKRSSALLSVARTITHLARHQNQGVGYVIENVPGVKDFPEVLETLGAPVLADAPPCGSLAKRETLFWTNLQPTQTLQEKFNAIKHTPVKSLRAFLKQNGFEEWDVPNLVGHNRAPKNDKYNTIGRPLAILPKFVCHPNARAYRRRGGYGRLLYKTTTAIPCIQIKEMVMGFQRNRTQAGGLADQHRHYLMGQCIDLNLLTWLMNECETQPHETRSEERPPQSSSPTASPEKQGPESIPPDTRLGPPDRANTLPVWQQAHDPQTFIYTDGSKLAGAPVLGAAVFHAQSEKITHIDATGSAECNTVVRAELVGIFHALQEYNKEEHIHILTDSLTAIQKIQLLHSQPNQSTKDHHQHVLRMIAQAIETRGQAGLTTKINKVPAHTGIWGNEIADTAAKSVVSAIIKHTTEENIPYPEWVEPTTVPMQPYRPPYFLTDDPPVNPDGTQRSPHVFTTKQILHNHIKPKLRLHTAPPSTYHTLMSQARNHNDPTDFKNTARHIKALIATGARHQAKRLLAFVWGTMYTQKHAFRFGYAKDQICPVCNIDTDSCTHVGSGCRHPHLKSLYIDRHSAAVRLIRKFIANSPVGASFTLICEDSGRKPLPEDMLNDENILEQQDAFLKTLPQPPHGLSPPPGHLLLNHRTEDVTLDLKAHNQAATIEGNSESQSPYEIDHSNTNSHTHAHQTIPEWVLPKEAQQKLLQAQAGFKPDLIFVQGAPSPNPAIVTKANLSQWKVTVIEVGFCADLRLIAKQEEKENKYQPLMKELRQRWTHVHFLAVPIGNAGAILTSTKQELGRLVSTTPQKKPEQRRSEQLARTLATMAARRLYGVTVEYYRLRKEQAHQRQHNSQPPGPMFEQGTSGTATHGRPLKQHKSATHQDLPDFVAPRPDPRQMERDKAGSRRHPRKSAGARPVPSARSRKATCKAEPAHHTGSTYPPRTTPTGQQYGCRTLDRQPG